MRAKTLIEAFLLLSEEDAAKVWVSLNRWEWPEQFPEALKPRWWDNEGLHNRQRMMGFNGPFMNHIKARVDDDLIQAEWEEATTGEEHTNA